MTPVLNKHLGRADVRLVIDQRLNEGHKEIVRTVAKLLHMGVLIVGALVVAVDSDPLVHNVTLPVVLLAQRLRDQLLRVPREQLQAIAVGPKPCRFLPLAPRRVVPTDGQKSSGITLNPGSRVKASMARAPAGDPRSLLPAALRATDQPRESSEVRPRRSPTWEASEANRQQRDLSSLPSPVTATACRGEGQTSAGVRRLRVEQAIAGLFRSAGLRITSTNVSAGPPSVCSMAASVRSNPSGSVLSKKRAQTIAGVVSAAAASWGPRPTTDATTS